MNRTLFGHDPRTAALLFLVTAFCLLAIWISWHFLPSFAWALIIAIAVDPLYLRIRGRWPTSGKVWLPLAVTLIVALAVLIPLAIGISRVAYEAHGVAQWIAAAQANGVPVPMWVDHLPYGGDLVRGWWHDHLATPESATGQLQAIKGTSWLDNSKVIGTSLLHHAVVFAFTLLTLFFLLRDREAIIAQFQVATGKLLGPAGDRISFHLIRSVRGTIDGLVLVGIGEGAVMAVVYLMAGVPHALLMGAATAIAAMIPFGAALLFAVAALLLLIQDSIAGAIAVVVIGLAVVAVADHFVRPVLIGNATRLPFLWVLIGILGGVEAFGLLGLFIGPATMAVLIMLWREFVGGADAPLAGEPLLAPAPATPAEIAP